MIQPRIDNWKKEIENNTKDCLNAFEGLDDQVLNIKPDTQTWSVAQALDHIIKTNESYYKELEEITSGRLKIPTLSKIGFINDFFGRFILKAVQPETKKKIKTFSIWEPEKSNIIGIVSRFKQAQNDLIHFIEENAANIENNMRIPSPAAKVIIYKFPAVIDILVAHEKRHLKQAKEILAIVRK